MEGVKLTGVLCQCQVQLFALVFQKFKEAIEDAQFDVQAWHGNLWCKM